MELGYLLMLAAIGVTAAALLAIVWVARRLGVVLHQQQDLPTLLTRALEEKHLAMIKDVHSGLSAQSDRLSASQTEASERVRASVSQDLKEARDAMLVLQLSQTEE